jgi:hypothetical protein
MAAYTGNLTNGRRPQATRYVLPDKMTIFCHLYLQIPSSSRNIAFLSIFAVIAGGYLAFRAQSPSMHEMVVSEKEEETMAGSPKGPGDRVGRGPAHQPKNEPQRT